VMCLLIIVTYVFAIAFTQLASGTEMGTKYFDNVALSMYSLMVYGTFLDALSDFCNDVLAESPVCLVMVFIFICLSAMTVMNMLIGVLCEVITAVAETEREDILTTDVSEKMNAIVKEIDVNNDGMISVKEFQQILEMPKAIQALQDVDIEPTNVVDFADLFFLDEGERIELPFEKFMDMILDLRGCNVATLKDIMNLSLQFKARFTDLVGVNKLESTELQERLGHVEVQSDSTARELNDLSCRLDDLRLGTQTQLNELKQSTAHIESQLEKVLGCVRQVLDRDTRANSR